MTDDNDLTQVRQLGFLFLTFGQVTDDELHPTEMRAIADQLKAWIPKGAGMPVTDLLKEVIEEYRMYVTEDERRIKASDYAELLRDQLSIPERKQVVRDILLIGKADGRVSDGELGFVSALMKIFELGSGVELELQPNPRS